MGQKIDNELVWEKNSVSDGLLYMNYRIHGPIRKRSDSATSNQGNAKRIRNVHIT
jgi:hypothetical protein